MPRSLLLKPVLIVLLAGAVALAHADDWSVDGERSSVGFVTVKNGAVVESHRFRRVSGSVSADGLARVSIDLTSVDTMIPIRDGRMRDLLFETGVFPTAEVSAEVDMPALLALDPGEQSAANITADLTIRGVTSPIGLDLAVIRGTEDRWVVTTTRDAVVFGESFGLGAGIEKLREIAGLASITPNVAVSFSLVLGPASEDGE